MQVRRRGQIVVQLQRVSRLDLAAVLAGRDGRHWASQWLLLSPASPDGLVVSLEQLALLQQLDEQQWQPLAALSPAQQQQLPWLLEHGLVETDQQPLPALEQAAHWHPLAAVFHHATRWRDADCVQAMESTGTQTVQGLRQWLGSAPPPALAERGDAAAARALPAPRHGPLQALLQRRVTCRNFDPDAALPLVALATVLAQTFGVHGMQHAGEDSVFLKRAAPSGGGLHPLEAYVLVQRVQGLAPGIYHYRCAEQALAPLPAPAQPMAALLHAALAGQHWFADAPVLVVITARFERCFWKYRQHAKAYRALLLEAGHFSQTLYLAATEAGLGAFVTCAVNDAVLEQALGLAPMAEGVLAVCGLGQRGEQMQTMELDPVGTVWEPAAD